MLAVETEIEIEMWEAEGRDALVAMQKNYRERHHVQDCRVRNCRGKRSLEASLAAMTKINTRLREARLRYRVARAEVALLKGWPVPTEQELVDEMQEVVDALFSR
jgi:hypothetical protein